jgi:DNA-binding transcriptional LysR family regulator
LHAEFASLIEVRRGAGCGGRLQSAANARLLQTVLLHALHAIEECVTMHRRQYDLPPLDQLEAFEAAARHLSFTRAADELALTQSAVSRQVAALEQFFGVPLFRRLHRALRLSDEGILLQQTVVDVLQRLHQASQALRGETRVKTVVVTTTTGFAGLWLIPRLARFTAGRPDVDVRISATNAMVNLDRDGVDLAIRYHTQEGAGAAAVRLFGEVVLPVCSPRLRRDPQRPLKTPGDLRHHCLLHMDGGAAAQLLEWPPWLRAMDLDGLKPASVLHFSQYDQMIQAAVSGQGVALGRLPLLDDLIARRMLVAPFKKTVVSPRSYFLLQSDASRRKPEVREFLSWLVAEAAAIA